MTLTGYLAPVELENELARELQRAGVGIEARYDRLFLSTDPAVDARWAANIWHDAQWIPITSIGHGARELRAIQRNWAMFAPLHPGRSRLISEKLPHVATRRLPIGASAPSAPLGSWMLVEPTLMLAASRCSDPFPNGVPRLEEDRSGPPSRAYLKLYEALSRAGRWPRTGETCLDLGASPGGWSWLAAQTGAKVIAVDKAPLGPTVAALGNVSWRQGSAFALDPRTMPHSDWLLSDIICYPGRLLGLVERWIAAGTARNIVCTIKFQGPTDHEIVERFASIEHATVRHLHHNKHELTFSRLDPLPTSSDTLAIDGGGATRLRP